jgi:hypothetical protein
MTRSRIAFLATIVVLTMGLVVWGTWAGSVEIMGAITTEDRVNLVVSDQMDATESVVIDIVEVPRDSWVVVHQMAGGMAADGMDGAMPGKRIGLTQVPAGESRDVVVELDPEVPLTAELLVVLHVDSGLRGEFEFDMDDMMHSPDKPYFVDGEEYMKSLTVAEFGVPVGMSDAMISAGDQPLGSEVVIKEVMSPTDAFVVVHVADENGMPGPRIGYTPVAAGESMGVVVELDEEFDERTTLIAALHADRGEPGVLEFDPEAPVDSPDQPFFAEGHEVAAAFDVGPFGVNVDSASIEATDQIGASESLVIDRVEAPTGAWIVVHKEVGGAPGPRVGIQRVEAGTSTDVTVPLDSETLPEHVIVALHADDGNEGVFDFDMMDKLGSNDHPFFVDGEEVAVRVKVRQFGIQVTMDEAMVEVSDQPVREATIRVDNVMAPADSWIVVHLSDADGMPGRRVGLKWIPRGMTMGAVVQLDASVPLTDTLLVALHADRGERQVFEFDMSDGVNSPDQPYFEGDMELAEPVRIR